MASHLFVIDTTMKRAMIKVTPATNLSNVLEDACKKLGYNPEQYTLKCVRLRSSGSFFLTVSLIAKRHNNKPVDLSRTIRLSGLSNGAKLNLVQASRSPSVVSIALQLPARGESPSIRLQDKFPSDTPIWQILRRFESGAAGGASSSENHNFTQQGTAQIVSGGSSGSGRLFYAMPVINIMGRELATFLDLQKTLGQLGFNGGTCLLRLSFRETTQPLEEAMTEISQYFQELEVPASKAAVQNAGAQERTVTEVQPTSSVDGADERDAGDAGPPPVLEAEADNISPTPENPSVASPETPQEQASQPNPNLKSSPHSSTATAPYSGLSIFAPPSSSTPAAAVNSHFNEEDYQPTIAHAQQHQSRLNNESRNKRLQSDKEIEQDQQALTEKLNSIQAITVRFRFPDNSSVNQTFNRESTARDLYTLCRELMDRPNDEAFTIKCPGPKGPLQLLEENDKKLIMDLQWQTRVVVTVLWGDNVTRRGPALKPQYIAQAQQLKVQLPESQPEPESPSSKASQGAKEGSQSKKSSGGDIESKLKGFLRLGKK